MLTNKIIFGITGLMASGKGTTAEYLEKKFGASNYRFSTMLRDLLDRLYLPHTRDNLIDISIILRQRFGEDLMAKTMSKDVENDKNKIIVVEGIRRMADIVHLSKLPGFVLVEVFADPKIRFERIKKRAENADDQSTTFEKFMEDHKRPTEVSILDVIKETTEKINNNGTMEELHERLDALVAKYAGKN